MRCRVFYTHCDEQHVPLQFIDILDVGYAFFIGSLRYIDANAHLDSISETTISTEGGAILTLYGYGFKPLVQEGDADYSIEKETSVTVNNKEMEILSANLSQVNKCIIALSVCDSVQTT